jgi:hypothetical protein
MAFSTIGDSFSIIATLGGVAVTAWSFKVACALLFPDRVEAARIAVSTKTSSAIGVGFLALLYGVVAFVVFSLPNPGTKLLGVLMLASYLALVAIGASGISMHAAHRLRELKGGPQTCSILTSKHPSIWCWPPCFRSSAGSCLPRSSSCSQAALASRPSSAP